MSGDGWIKLHRKIRDNAIFNDPYLFRLWIICLTEATYKKREQVIGKQVVTLEPGQFVTGRSKLEQLFKKGLTGDQQISAISLWRWMQNLKNAGFIDIKSNNKFSVISIENWALYQQEQQVDEQQNDQQMNNKRTTDEQQTNTNKKVKKEKNNKDSRPKRVRIYDESSEPYILAKYLRDRILRWKPNAKVPVESPEGLAAWADDVRKMIEIDNRDKRDIGKVIRWATEDSFWQKNIFSAGTLRDQYDKLEAQMNGKVVRMPEQPAKEQKSAAYEKFSEELLQGWE